MSHISLINPSTSVFRWTGADDEAPAGFMGPRQPKPVHVAGSGKSDDVPAATEATMRVAASRATGASPTPLAPYPDLDGTGTDEGWALGVCQVQNFCPVKQPGPGAPTE